VGNTNRLDLGPTQAAKGQFDLLGPSKNTQVVVRDENNNAVRTLDLGGMRAGVQTFQWDGKTDEGARAPSGKYKFNLTATDGNGLPVTTSTQVSGRVSEIDYSNGSPELLVAGLRLSLGDITTIGL
jgi:flagellar basal-body rod modification protein FlgD